MSQGSVPRWSCAVPNDAPRRCSLLLLALPIQAQSPFVGATHPGSVAVSSGAGTWCAQPGRCPGVAAGSLADPGGRGVPVGAAQSGAAPSSTNCCMPKLCPQSWCLERVGCKEGGGLACATSGGRDCGHFQRLLLGRYTAVWAVNCTLARHLGGTLPHPTHCTPASATGGNSCIPIIWRPGQDGHGNRNRQGAVPLYTSSRAPFSLSSQPFVSQLKT